MKKQFLIGLLKDSFISIFISIFLLFFIEVGYRGYSKYKSSNLKENKEEEKFKFLKIAFDNKFTFDELKDMQPMVNSFINYKSWIQIGNVDHKNKYSISLNNLRKTVSKTNKNCEDKKIVWFFGGSTTYGVGVPYDLTIPSQFATLADEKGLCLEVLNFGTPYHSSFYEVMYLSSELAKNNLTKPDIVIFTDGLNDFNHVMDNLKQEGFFTSMIKRLVGSNNDEEIMNLNSNSPVVSFNFKFKMKSIDFIRNKFFPINNYADNDYSNYRLPNGMTDEQAGIDISKRMLKTKEYASKICRSFEIKCYQFLQPVSLLHYKPKYGETLSRWIYSSNLDKKARFKKGFENLILLNKNGNNDNYYFVDMSKIFNDYEDGIPYVDPGHYSPRANLSIARFMYNKIFLK